MVKIKNWKVKLAVTALVGALYFVLYLAHAKCIFLTFTGYPCPGCGMTRACISALHGQFLTAFRYHGMFWSLPVLYLYILFDGKLFRRKYLDTVILVLIAIGFAINYVYHLFIYI